MERNNEADTTTYTELTIGKYGVVRRKSDGRLGFYDDDTDEGLYYAIVYWGSHPVDQWTGVFPLDCEDVPPDQLQLVDAETEGRVLAEWEAAALKKKARRPKKN